MRRLPVPWASPGEAVFFVVLILFAVGTINVFSASFVLAGQLLGDSYFFLKRHLLAFVVGMVGLAVAARLDYHRLPRYLFFAVVAVLAMLVAVHFAGVDANGAKRWLKIGIKFQPSEFAKIVAVMMAASYLGPRIERNRPVSIMSWPVFATAVMSFLVLRQPDMGTAVVIMGLCLVLYLPSGIPKLQVYGLLFGAATATVYLVYAAAYRAERIMAWLDPWAYEQTSGYQTVQALMAIGSGSLFGTGLGMGASKFHYLPEAHTDFAFAVLCQEMGFAGAFFILGLFALVAWQGAKIALGAEDGFGMILAAGATFLVVGQAVGNIAMVCGLLPVTGIPLPFISFGGTSLLVNLVAVGLLISVGRHAGGKAARPARGETGKESGRLKLVTRPTGK